MTKHCLQPHGLSLCSLVEDWPSFKNLAVLTSSFAKQSEFKCTRYSFFIFNQCGQTQNEKLNGLAYQINYVVTILQSVLCLFSCFFILLSWQEVVHICCNLSPQEVSSSNILVVVYLFFCIFILLSQEGDAWQRCLYVAPVVPLSF